MATRNLTMVDMLDTLHTAEANGSMQRTIVRTPHTLVYRAPQYLRATVQNAEDMIIATANRTLGAGIAPAILDSQLASEDTTRRFAQLVQLVTTARNRRSR